MIRKYSRPFAEATGRLAKTDRVDARMLARFGAALDPECRPLRSETLDQLAELVAARRALVKDRTATLNRQKTARLALLTRQTACRLTQIDAQIKAIDAAARALIEGDASLDRRRVILESICGFGETTAIALLAEMPELGTLDEKQAVALAGLAPMTRQSGTWKGKSRIRGGRAHVRQTLFMPAMVAARFNADMKAKLETLIKAGKPPKVAITAVMRKLVVLANATAARRSAVDAETRLTITDTRAMRKGCPTVVSPAADTKAERGIGSLGGMARWYQAR